MDSNKTIKFNIKAHNKIARKYEKKHGEIFNDIEQARIRDAVVEIITTVRTGGQDLKALDVGCGSGNLSRHLIGEGVYTVSADVSEKFLELVEAEFSGTGLCETMQLNGQDLNGLEDCTFDIAATYSVLHHVPDYLHLLKEMCRVLKHGGVIYLDHEGNEAYFNKSVEYTRFLKLAKRKSVAVKHYLGLLFSFGFYVRFIRKRINPRFKGEGDIHVWPDDHIEWDKIEKLLYSEGFHIVKKQDYLNYNRRYRKEVYELYKDKCNDTTMLIARKE